MVGLVGSEDWTNRLSIPKSSRDPITAEIQSIRWIIHKAKTLPMVPILQPQPKLHNMEFSTVFKPIIQSYDNG